MATRVQIENCIKYAVAAFNTAFPYGKEITDSVEFEIVCSGKYEERLREVERRLCAEEKEYDKHTVAEVVIGGKGIAVLVYSRRFPDGIRGEITIAHELGHILDAITNADISLALRILDEFHTQAPFSVGGALWSEFIASVIANRVYSNRDFLVNAYDYGWYITDLLDHAILSGAMDVPSLGIYFAALLSDKESLALQEDNQPPLIGMAHCSDGVIAKLLDISDILIEQTEESEPFWLITQERLIELGNRIISLYDLLQEEGIITD